MEESKDTNSQKRILEGRYANYFEIGHNEVEFIFGFGQYYEGEESMVHTRIVTSPAYARILLATLTQSVAQFSEQIQEAEQELAAKTSRNKRAYARKAVVEKGL